MPLHIAYVSLCLSLCMKRFHTLLSVSTCAATVWACKLGCDLGDSDGHLLHAEVNLRQHVSHSLSRWLNGTQSDRVRHLCWD